MASNKKLTPQIQEMFKKYFDMQILRGGDDFFINLEPDQEILEKYFEMKNISYAKAAAASLGLEDYKPLLSPETRTQEQQELMLKIAGAQIRKNLETYMASDYHKTEEAIVGEGLDCIVEQMISQMDESARAEFELRSRDHISRDDTTEKQRDFNEKLCRSNARIQLISRIDTNTRDDIDNAFSWLNVAFYVRHKDLDPKAEGCVTDEQIEELKRSARDFVAYHAEHPGQTYFESYLEFLQDPIREQVEEKITEISQDEYFNLPLSKAWRKQGLIAQEGARGYELNVGHKTKAGEVIITATISDKDGNPIELDELCKGVQRAIGNLIDEAGGVLPICVTTQQIYRAFARKPHNCNVTEAQEHEINVAMDKLLYAPAKLDYRLQLEKHKHIKQQNDYDYTGPRAGRDEGTMITGIKRVVQAHDGSIVWGYVIYEYPVFYRYSHIIGQMARVPNSLLTGGTKPALKENNQDGVQGSAKYTAVRENILERVLRMQERNDGKKAFSNIIKLEDVAGDCNITLTDRSKRTLHKNIGLYLEELQQAKQIKAYKEHKAGRKIDGYMISL